MRASCSTQLAGAHLNSIDRKSCLGKAQTQSLFGGFSFNWRVRHDVQRKGLVLGFILLRPLLVWRGYWIDGDNVMSKETGGNAFPYSGVHSFQGRGGITVDDRGMSLRDYFAAKAMSSLVISGLNTDAWSDYEDMAESAYSIADAMLKARNQ